jgi:hypothetical protein
MVEMANIMRSYGPAYIAKYGGRMLTSHKRAIEDIIRCRTKDMGGKVYECPEHHEVAYKYHSCMNRSCPKCQNDQAESWLRKERKRLIDVPYFFVTVTLPQELRPVARSNQRLFYKLMFEAAFNALKKLARDPRFVGGLIGALAVLHTWTRKLMYHPHIHLLVPGGGVSTDHTVWLSTQPKFLIPESALSKIYKAMLRDALKLIEPKLFKTIPRQVWFKDWVLHCKSAGNGEAVLKYFAPYVFRVAISNKRIIKLENDRVTFIYKHPKTKQWIPVTLHVFEFMRRFLQHVLPRGFKKVRHYGFLNSKYKGLLTTLQYVLGTVEHNQQKQEPEDQKPDIPCCPICGKQMILIGLMQPDYVQLNEQFVPP